MSYLYRSGTGRNNIAFTNTANSSTKYLRRTASSRNSIVWTTIPSGSTYNILQRNGTGRNNILWSNLKIGPDLSANAIKNNMHVTTVAWWYALTDTFEEYNTSLAVKYKSNSAEVAICGFGVNNILYETNKITFTDGSFRISDGGDFYQSDNPNYADFVNYPMITIFCSQQPPTEYINAISSVIAFISSRSETYPVRAVKYGYMDFGRNGWYRNAFNNCLAISLDADSTMRNVTTQYSICFS